MVSTACRGFAAKGLGNHGRYARQSAQCKHGRHRARSRDECLRVPSPGAKSQRDADAPYDIPLLTRAAAHIEHVAIRNRETLGGSLDNTDPAAGLRQLCVTAARPVRRQARHTVSATFRRFTLHEAVNVSTLPQEVG